MKLTLIDELRVQPGKALHLARLDPGKRLGAESKSDGLERLACVVEALRAHRRVRAAADR